MNSLYHLMTPVSIQPHYPKIGFNTPVLMAGSCFAEHMDHKLSLHKYKVLSNPFGILYNSASLADSFSRITQKQYYNETELVRYDNLFHSMDHHGVFSGIEKEKVLDNINRSIDAAHDHLKHTKFVFVSLGTSKVYKYRSGGKIVGNNHKIPTGEFEPYAQTVEECHKDLNRTYQSIQTLSPGAQVIWTVSPVRHLRDGFVENQRSKAVLILAIKNFMDETAGTSYFPAYEIMMDQLRDYRFYASDMIHPSGLAIDIIWELFCEAYFDPLSTEHHSAMEKIQKAMHHRFLHENDAAIKSFAEAQLRNIDHLAKLFPDMDWKKERDYFFRLIEPD